MQSCSKSNQALFNLGIYPGLMQYVKLKEKSFKKYFSNVAKRHRLLAFDDVLDVLLQKRRNIELRTDVYLPKGSCSSLLAPVLSAFCFLCDAADVNGCLLLPRLSEEARSWSTSPCDTR